MMISNRKEVVQDLSVSLQSERPKSNKEYREHISEIKNTFAPVELSEVGLHNHLKGAMSRAKVYWGNKQFTLAF